MRESENKEVLKKQTEKKKNPARIKLEEAMTWPKSDYLSNKIISNYNLKYEINIRVHTIQINDWKDNNVKRSQIFFTEKFQKFMWICRYSLSAPEGEAKFPILPSFPVFRLYLVTCFQRLRYERQNFNLTVEKPGRHYLGQVIKDNIIGDKSCQ